MVHRYADSTRVLIYSRTQKPPPAGDSLHFQRTYFRRETRYLSLDGLGGDDIFEVTTTVTTRPMPLGLYGGEGHDLLRLHGSGRRLNSYDAAPDLTAVGARPARLPRKNHRAYDRLNDD